MDLLWQGIEQAARLIAAGDPDVIEIARLSLEVSALATLLALVVGVPFGVWIGLKPFPGRNLIVSLVNTGMGLPPVVVGLFVTIFLWRSGPFGFLGLLYTPAAIVVAQLILALPVVIGLTIAAVQQIDPRLSLQLLGLGASRAQLLVLLLREARLPLLAAVMAGFGAVISEVGASLMVGGNILHHTRVLTTATVLETSKGNFDVAIALSLILLGISFVINLALTLVQQRATRR
jgi:tungstate transport system permease protein